MAKRRDKSAERAVFRFFARLGVAAYYYKKPAVFLSAKIFESFCPDVSVG